MAENIQNRRKTKKAYDNRKNLEANKFCADCGTPIHFRNNKSGLCVSCVKKTPGSAWSMY